ncbi:MAG: CDP-alcohol phosphatidyltransferase family protein [Pleurocapsa sp.]
MNRVFLFVPNIIGYFRFGFYLASFTAHAFHNWRLCFIFYIIGFVLDEFDGRAARAFNQNSNFGAALDMVADRSATAGLCLILAQLYPNFLLAFIIAIALDISSHYYSIYAKGILGKSSHKDTELWANSNGLLKLYYGSKPFMDLLILGNELLYIFLYLAYYIIGVQFSLFQWEVNIWQVAIALCLPIYLLKQLTNILQLQSSAIQIAAIDAKGGLE